MKLNEKEIKSAVEKLSRCIMNSQECCNFLMEWKDSMTNLMKSLEITVEVARQMIFWTETIVKLSDEMGTCEPNSWIGARTASMISGLTEKTLRKYAKVGMIKKEWPEKTSCTIKRTLLTLSII